MLNGLSHFLGFSLTEVIVTATIAGILASVAIPAMFDLIKSSLMPTQANDIHRAFKLNKKKFVGLIKRHPQGFTLIELMIVVAIIGILFAIALPNYFQNVQEGRRVDVQQFLLQQVAGLERQYSRLGQYPNSNAITADDYYSFYYALVDSDSSTFILKAIPNGSSSQGSDRCGTLSINHRGITTPTSDDCWR